MTMQSIIIGTISRHWPFANGSGRIIDRFASGIDLGRGERVCQTSDGFDINVLSDDHIGRHIVLSGRFDRSPIGILLNFCATGDRCIDVGANIGYVACLILHCIPNSTILCVEPQPGITSLLRTNMARFSSSRWRIIEAALSESDGEAFLQLNLVNRGASTIVKTPSESTIKVPMLSASRILGELNKLDIMKVDIEGHEALIFRSGLVELERLHPRAILYEDRNDSSSYKDEIRIMLQSIGYQVFGIKKSLLSTTLAQVTSVNRRDFNDFIAISKKRPVPKRALTLMKGLGDVEVWGD